MVGGDEEGVGRRVEDAGFMEIRGTRVLQQRVNHRPLRLIDIKTGSYLDE